MSGKAMLTIVASMNAMTPPSDAIASTTRGSGPRRRWVGATTTVGAPAGSAVVIAMRPGSFLDRQTRCQLGVGGQRLGGHVPADVTRAADGVPRQEADSLDVQRDDRVGVQPGGRDRVDAADGDGPHDRLAEAGDPRVAARQEAADRPLGPGDAGTLGLGEATDGCGDVDRDLLDLRPARD